jgi:hypothetical protein
MKLCPYLDKCSEETLAATPTPRAQAAMYIHGDGMQYVQRNGKEASSIILGNKL